jgi:hypothetical protein
MSFGHTRKSNGEQIMKTVIFSLAAVALLWAAELRAEEDHWAEAARQANGKIQRYQQATRAGNPLATRQALLELQADPVAIRLMNKDASEGLKTRFNQDIEGVKAQTRELIREPVARQTGANPEHVSTFEATNKPQPGQKVKVGQDWDLTVRSQGRDVPTEVARPITHQAYYQAATGKVPPRLETRPDGTVSPEARSRYNQAAQDYAHAANHFAHQQALEVTHYQHPEAYGGSSREGGAIINGPKGARLRDPAQISQVIEYKSSIAGNQARELRAQGDHVGAVGRDLEQMRQSSKQFDAQVVPRVEAVGGKIPYQVQQGQNILRRVENLKLTPHEGRQALREMGETPETIINKTAGLVEAGQVLRHPASRGEPPPDVFVDNVRNRLRNKGIEVSELPAPENQAPRGNSGFSGNAQRGAAALWMTAVVTDGVAREEERSLRTGEAPSRTRAALNAMSEATMVPNIVRSIPHGTDLRDKHIAEAERYHSGGINAHLTGQAMAVREFVGELTGINQGTKIGKEEIEIEERRAAREGREPNYARSAWNGAARGLGETFGVGTIFRAAIGVSDEEFTARGADQEFRAWLQRKANEYEMQMRRAETDLYGLLTHGDPQDPGFRQQYNASQERYDRARIGMANVADAGDRQLGQADPQAKGLHDRVGRLPDPLGPPAFDPTGPEGTDGEQGQEEGNGDEDEMEEDGRDSMMPGNNSGDDEDSEDGGENDEDIENLIEEAFGQ